MARRGSRAPRHAGSHRQCAAAQVRGRDGMTPSGGAKPWFDRAVLAFGNPYLLLALTSLFWSGNHIVGRAAGGVVPPLALSTLRWFLPSALLWIVARHHILRDWPTIRTHWKILLWFGVTGGVLFT